MASSSNVFSSCSVLHAEHSFSNHLSGIGSNNMDTKDGIVLVSQYLNESFAIVVGSCSAVGLKWEHALVVLLSFCLKLFFSFSNVSYFRVSVNNSWNRGVVDMTSAVNNVLNSSNAFLLGFMSKHGALDNVSNCVNVFDFGL